MKRYQSSQLNSLTNDKWNGIKSPISWTDYRKIEVGFNLDIGMISNYDESFIHRNVIYSIAVVG